MNEALKDTKSYCKKCILPESYPGISFNEEGICNYCLKYKPHHEILGGDKLLEVLTSQPKTGQYHCVVPVSGGKDSAYILYYIVKKLGLKPLAVTYDSGFQHEISIENARNACRILNVPLIEVKSSVNIRSKMLKESLLVSKKVGYFWHQCGNCEAILRNMSINTAKTYGAPFIVWGSSALESGDDQTYDSYKNLGGAQDNILFKIKRKILFLLKNPEKISTIPRIIYSYVGYHSIKYYFYSIYQRLALGFPYRFAFRPHAIIPFENKTARFVHFFDYVDWNSIKNIELLKNELNWKHPVGQDARWDCKIHCLGNYAYLKMYTISGDGINACNFIRENKVNRESAMEKEIDLSKSVEHKCEELIRGIGLKNYTLGFFKKILRP